MKVRHLDLHPDEFLAAVAGEMSPAELGVYWMVCLLIYARGGPIENDIAWLRGKFRRNKGNNVISDALDALKTAGRVTQDGSKLTVRRCEDELEMARRRIQDASESGRRGGRPRNDNNGLGKGSGFKSKKGSRKLTTNHQPPTTNNNTPPPPNGGVSAEEEFGIWWAEYPRKVGKDAAVRKYLIARRSVDADELLDAVKRYASACPADKQYIAHPATWLHQGRWKDEPADSPPNGHDRPTEPPPSPEDLWPDLRTTH